MQSTLFWCGSIVLLHNLQNAVTDASFTIELVRETVCGKICTYEVLLNGKKYTYNFTMSSNTKLIGSMFIKSDNWTSHVYSVEKLYGFIHISETSIDFHDIYFVNNNNAIDIYIRSGKKSAIATLSITENKKKYIFKPTVLPIERTSLTYSARAMAYLFAISGAIDKIKLTINDVVSYAGKNMSLITYTDAETQVIGIVTYDYTNNKSSLQCVNSFFNQYYEFYGINDDVFKVTEYVDGMTKSHIKRAYSISVKDSGIIDVDTDTTYKYTLDDGDVIFRKL